MAMPGEYDILLYSGDTLSRTFTFTDSNDAAIDLTGQTPGMKLRVNPEGSESADWTSYLDNTNAATGVITLTVPSTVTDDLTAGLYSYDFQLANGAEVTTYLVGNVIVTKDVTRS